MNEFDLGNTGADPQDDPLGDALRRWADDVDGYTPLDTAEWRLPERRQLQGIGWRTAAGLAAAAAFIFALTQVSFTVSYDGTTLRWGNTASSDVDTVAAALADAEARYATLEKRLNAHAEAINAVALDNVLLGESLHATAIELAQRQELESAARAYDVQHLAQLVSNRL